MVVYMDPLGKELSDESDGISCKRLCKCKRRVSRFGLRFQGLGV